MRLYFTLFCLLCNYFSFAQVTYSGVLVDQSNEAIGFANIVLYASGDSSIVKVESTDIDGKFSIVGKSNQPYYLQASYIGNDNLIVDELSGNGEELIDLGTLIMVASGIELETALVTGKRAIVEIKPDRTVFNVQGTINAAGDNGLDLLRKAPGVLIDNNNNITVLGRNGVLVYIDGKRLPLSGDDLTNYLRNLSSEQIDKIDIISNPGAKYEAQGNAGILDIRLKKSDNQGYSGTVGGSFSMGKHARSNLNGNANYRNKNINAFGNLGVNQGIFRNDIIFKSYQNDIYLDEVIQQSNDNQSYNWRFGTDYYLPKSQTIGFLISGNSGRSDRESYDGIDISKIETINQIDSVLIADNDASGNGNAFTFNANYVLNGDKHKLNIDLDYGTYKRDLDSYQPNRYFLEDRVTPLSEIISSYETPVKIDISSFKVDYETNILGGELGLGSKLSQVATNNTYLFYDIEGEAKTQNNLRSNLFYYDENVYAGYFNYKRPINKVISFSGGLRVEKTDANGDLQAFLEELQEDPVVLNYTNYFPSAGLTFQKSANHIFNLNYGRRINRADYNVLNPFKIQISELSASQGNPFLRPEIVNNYEFGYTLKYLYNFKLSYSKTLDQITRLIAPDKIDPRAAFVTWENLAEQTIVNFTASAPIQINKWWNMFTNINFSWLNNQADYGDGGVVDVQAYSYTLFQQNTIGLPSNFNLELTGIYSGPGVWGGVFLYEPTHSINVGIQKSFLSNSLNAKLNFSDITYSTGWRGTSEFNGLDSYGEGNNDSRRVNLTLSYNFGNSKVKSRKRSTGLESESQRISGS